MSKLVSQASSAKLRLFSRRFILIVITATVLVGSAAYAMDVRAESLSAMVMRLAGLSGAAPAAEPSGTPQPRRQELGNLAPRLAPLTGDLANGRSGHTATRLADGRVMVAGGDANGTAEIYDPATDMFSAAGTMTAARSGHTASLLADGRVLIIGGTVAGAAVASTEVFDPSNGTFSAGPSMNAARSGQTATTLADGRVVVIGGDPAGSIEIYDPAANSFSSVAVSLASPRSGHGAAVLQNGSILVVGGIAADGSNVQTGEIVDLANGAVSAVSNPTSDEHNHPLLRVLSDGKAQIIGGTDHADMEIYDPAINAFGAHSHVFPIGDSHPELVQQITNAPTRTALFYHGASGTLLDREGETITELPASNKALVVGGTDSSGAVLSSSSLLASSPASITTDKLDYAPGTPVVVTGTGFAPNETVTLTFHEDPHPATENPHTFTVTTDANGNFTDQSYAPEDSDVGVAYILAAVGGTSGYTVQTALHDAITLDSVAVGSQVGSLASGTAGNATYPICITYHGSNSVITFSVTGGLPSGVTANFSPSSTGTTPAQCPTSASTLTLSTSSGTPAGSFTFTVQASGGGTRTNTGTLSVGNGSQTISFAPLAGRAYGDAPFTVSATGGGSGNPITFAATGNCSSSGVNGSTITITAPGSCTVTASQAGNANYNAAPNVQQSFTINKANTSGSVASSENPASSGNPMTFTATVSKTQGSTTPTGTVQFMDGASPLGSPITLDASAKATVTTSTLTVATHSITAVYSGDTNYSTSTSAALSQVINTPTCAPICSTDVWSTENSMPNARGGAMSTDLNGILYMISGFGSSGLTNEVDAFDPTTGTWSVKASIPNARVYGGATSLNGKIYVVGGCLFNDCRIGTTNLVDVYDPTTNSWSSAASLSVARHAFAIGTINGKIVVAGGRQACPPCNDAPTTEVYDPSTNLWSTKTSMPTPRNSTGYAVLNNLLYVVGGSTSSGVSGAVEAYDPTANSWSTKATMLTPRTAPGVASIGGKIYAISGQTAASPFTTNVVEGYDPATDSWSSRAPIPTARYGAQPVSINGRIYVAGNGAGNTAITAVESYKAISLANMVAWFPGNNNTNDVMGGNNGTWVGTSAYGTGKVGQAFSFDGTKYIDAGNPTALNITGNQVTIDGWVNPSDNTSRIYFGKTVYGANDYLIFNNSGHLSSLVKIAGVENEVAGFADFGTNTVPYAMPVGQWTHVALTYDGSKIRLYANGAQVGEASKTGNIAGDVESFVIGGRSVDNGTAKFTGLIDEVEVFNRALSQAEIKSIFDASFLGKCNTAPVANAQTVTTNANTAVPVTLTGTDAEGNYLTYSVVTGPTNGTLSGTAPNLTYTPTTGYSGTDSFTFKVNDGFVDSAIATVTINVHCTGPTVSTNPTPVSVTYGAATATFTAAATGVPTPTVKWQVSTNGGTSWTPLADTGNYSGTTTNTLTITLPTVAQSGSLYRAEFTSTCAVADTTGALLTVAPKALTASIIGNPTKTYNGNTNATLTPANFSISGLVGSESFTVTQTAGTYNSPDVATANSVTATLAPVNFTAGSGTSAANYTFPTSATGAGSITKATPTVAVSFGTSPITYDGDSHAAIVTVTGVGSVTLTGTDGTTQITYLKNGNSFTGTPTDVGTYSASAAFTSTNGNYNSGASTTNATLVINKANATCTVTAYHVTFDTTAHTATGACTGVKSENLSGLVLSGTTHTNAGTYNGDIWTFTDVTGNYNNTSGTVDDQIDQATPTLTTSGGTFTYDGNGHPSVATATGIGGAAVSGTFVYTYTPGGSTAPVNASATPYSVSAAFTSNDTNYNNGTPAVNTITINKSDTATAITSNTPNPSNAGQSVAVHYSVVAVAPGGGVPTGNVTVTASTTESCTGTVAAGTCSITFATAGPRTITASFGGDANFNGSTSSSVSQNVNAVPVAVNDSYTTTEENLLTVNAPGVLGNDSDADAGPSPLTAVLNAGPSHGAVTLNLNGSFTYQPAAGFTGADSFTYHATDGLGDSNVATVSINSSVAACVAPNQGGGWKARASVPTAYSDMGVEDVNGKLYAVGGTFGGCSGLNTLQSYDPSTDAWTSLAPMPTPRWQLGSASLGGKLYVAGGAIGCGAPTNVLEVYDPTSNTWATKAPLPQARYGLQLAPVNGKIYAIGGQVNGGDFNDVWEYDPSADTWTAKAPLPDGRTQHRVAVLNNLVYVTGGFNGAFNGESASLFIYNPATDAWATGASLPETRVYHASGALNGKVYVYGGSTPSNAQASVLSYDPSTNSWSNEQPMLEGRFAFGHAVSGGKLYAIGGLNTTHDYPGLSSVEAFTPSGLSNMVAWYPGNGNTNDVMGGNNGTLSGAAYSAGKVGQTFSFNGSPNSYMSAPSTPALQISSAFTVDAWIKPNSAQSPIASIVSKGSNSAGAYALETIQTEGGDANPRSLRFFFWSDSTHNYQVNAKSWLTPDKIGTWRHIAATYDSTTGDILLYDNGALIATSSGSDKPAAGTLIGLNDHELAIGSRQSAGSGTYDWGFDGSVDEVEVFNRALSSSEIKSIFDASFAGKCNTAPVANSQSLSTNAETPLPITLTSSDAEGNFLTYLVNGGVLTTAHGTISATNSANLTYTPNPGFVGTDSFTFTVNDGFANSAPATITIDVKCTGPTVSTNPTAVNVTYGAATATFTAAATGVPTPTVKWQVSTNGGSSWTPLTNTGNYSGATTNTLTITLPTVAQSGSLYRAEFTSTCAVADTTGALLTVAPKALTASIAGNLSKIYDGTTNATLTPGNFNISGVVSPDSFNVTKTAGTYNSPDVATANSVTATLAASDFSPVGGTLAANYTFPTSATGAGSITKATPTVAVSFGTSPITYDGDSHAAIVTVTGVGSVTLTGTDGTTQITYLKNGNSFTGTPTDVGTYSASAAFTSMNGNYNNGASTTNATLVINKANATCTVTAYHVTFDTTAHTATGSCTGVKSENLTGLDLSGTTHTDAGTYNADHWTFTDTTGNYNDTSGTVDDKIDQATPTLTTSGGTFTFDGNSHPSVGSAKGVGGVVDVAGSFTYTYTPPGNATAPVHASATPYAVSAAFASTDPNYNNGTPAANTITINKATSTTVITCTPSVVFDGSAKEPCSATATGAGGLNAPVTVVYGNNINAGTATADATYAGDTDHDGSTATQVTFTIEKASSTTTVLCPASETFTGFAIEPCTASYSGPGGLTGTLTPTYVNNVNVGIATANASFGGDANHEASSDSKTFDITKAGSTTSVTCQASVVFNGVEQTPCSAAVTGVGGLNQSLTLSYSDNTHVGTASASATFDGDANHFGSTDSKTFDITKYLFNVCDGDGHCTGGSFPNNENSGGRLTITPSVAYGGSATANVSLSPASLGGNDSLAGAPNPPDAPLPIRFKVYISSPDLTQPVFFGSGVATKTNGDTTWTTSITTALATSLPPGSYTAYVYGDDGGTLTSNAVQADAGYEQAVTADFSYPTLTAPLTITQATPTVTATGGTFTYNAQAHGGSGTATGVGGVSDVLSPEVTLSYEPGGSSAPVDAGTYSVIAHFAGNTNYSAADSAPAEITITPKDTAASITASDKPYDGTTAATITTCVVDDKIGSDDVTCVANGTNTFDGKDVGTHNVTATGITLSGLKANNYHLTPDSATTTAKITAVTLIASIIGDPTKVYDGNANATLASTNFQISGLVATENFTVKKEAGTYNHADVSTADTVSTTLLAGDFTAADGTTASNYVLPTTASGPGHIKPAHLTVTADDQSKTYDGLVFSPFTATITGFVNGETDATLRASGGLSGATGFTGTAVSAVNASSTPYTITPTIGTLAANNYDFPFLSFVNGSLTIKRRAATWTTNPAGKTYGDTEPSPLASGSGNNFVATDNISASYTRDAGEPVGGYHITATLNPSNALSNYDITNNGAEFTISKATLSVNAVPASKNYGQSDPTFQFTLSGFKLSDDNTNAGINGAASCSRNPGEAVATSPYTITCSAGTLLAANYDFATGSTASLTIHRATLVVTPDPQTITYGQPDPSFTFHYAGFEFTDDYHSLMSQASCSASGTSPHSAAGGPYAISCAAGTAANYDFNVSASALLTVSKASLTITASTHTVTFGDPAPTVAASYSGFVLGDTYTSLMTKPICSTTYSQGAPVSGSPYSSSCSSAASANYDIAYVGGSVTVIKANANCSSITGYTGTYDGGPHGASGLCKDLGGATLSGLNLGTSYTNAPGGNAHWVFTDATGNYNNAMGDAQIAISRKTLKVTASGASLTYGDPVPTITPIYDGFIPTEGAGNADHFVAPTCSTGYTTSTQVAASPVATNCSSGSATNYAFTYVPGSVVIGPKALTVTANNQSKLFGNVFTFTGNEFTTSGLINRNTVTSATITSDGSPALASAGAHTIVITNAVGTGLSNYAIGYTNGTLTVNGYGFTGFGQPIDNTTGTTKVWNTAKATQAIPAKWMLMLGGLAVSDPTSFVSLESYKVDCTSGDGSIESAIEEVASGNSGLIYNGSGNWQYNWKTPNTYGGQCRAMFVRFKDGSISNIAYFKFK